MSAPAAAANAGLRRVIGFWGGTALVVGMTIGSGIFRKPPTIAGLIPDPRVVLGLWVAIGIITLCGALTIAELASMMPETGGVYVYLRRGYGEGAAFVFGWLSVLVSAPATVGALATVSVEFLLGALRIPPDRLPGWGVPAVAIGVIAFFTVLNLVGTKTGTAVQGALTVVKVTALVVLILAVFALGQGSWANLSPAVGAEVEGSKLARAVSSVLWTYDGWIAAAAVAGEVLAPQKLLRRIIIAGVLTLIGIYVFANVAYHYMLPVDVLVQEKGGIAARVMSDIFGPVGASLIGFAIVASVTGALSANVLARPRVAFAMAREGLTFRALGHAHPRFNTPDVAIVVQGVLAAVMVAVLQDFDKLTTYFVVVEWFALIFAVAAVFALRRRLPDAIRPFKVPLYPLVPLVFVIGTGVGLGTIVWGEWTNGNKSPVFGLGIAALGIPFYLFVRKKRDAPTLPTMPT
jgi:basic amino acid/polyamine antiporter, APA family